MGNPENESMSFQRLLYLVFLALFFSSCGGGDGPAALQNGSSTGSVVFRLGNPQQQAVAQIVSARVDLLVPGTSQQVLPSQSLVFGQTVVFSPVPVGSQLVKASGFDSDGNLIATDEVVVNVLPGQASQARLVLTPGLEPEPEPEPDPEPTPPAGTTLIYIGFQGTDNGVSVVDADTYQPVAGSPISVSSPPREMAIDVAGERLFVVNNGFVSVFNARTLTPIMDISVPGDAPFGVAYDPDRDQVFVSDSATTQVFVFDATAGSPAGIFSISSSILFEVVYFEDKIYVADANGNALHVHDASTFSPVAGSPFNAGGSMTEPRYLKLDAANRRILVGLTPFSIGNSEVAVFDIDSSGFVAGSPFSTGVMDSLTGVGFDSVGNRVLASVEDNFVLLDGTTFGPAAGSPLSAGAPLFDVLFESTRNRIIGTEGGGTDIVVVDGSSLTPIAGSPFAVAPDGSFLRNVESATFPDSP